MTKKMFVKEHVELIKTLKNPTKRKLAKEAREQSEELKRVMRKKTRRNRLKKR